MRVSEWIAFSYFAYLLAVAFIWKPWRDRRRALVVTALSTLSVIAIAGLPDDGYSRILRDWMPGVYLLTGYWASALYFVSPMPLIEERCLALDRRLGVNVFVARAPRVVLEILELFYFACFPFVPACVALVILADRQLADRSWALVLAGEFGAFGMMPWVQTRPPRAIEVGGPIDERPIFLRALNRFMVRHTSIQVNTLPSGHVAGGLTAALAVWLAFPKAGVVAFLIACGVTLGAVVGRYHYAVDAITGVGVALLAWTFVSAVM